MHQQRCHPNSYALAEPVAQQQALPYIDVAYNDSTLSMADLVLSFLTIKKWLQRIACRYRRFGLLLLVLQLMSRPPLGALLETSTRAQVFTLVTLGFLLLDVMMMLPLSWQYSLGLRTQLNPAQN